MMNKLVFNSVDKNIVFTVSPLDWSQQRAVEQMSEGVATLALPPATAADAGKFLVIGSDGTPQYAQVKPGAVDFNIEQHTITGSLGSPEANLNAMEHPLVVHPSQLVFLSDPKEGKTYVWVGGVGTFGYQAGGTTVTNSMLSEIKGGDLDVIFSTPDEVTAGQSTDTALNPNNAINLDVNGGTF